MSHEQQNSLTSPQHNHAISHWWRSNMGCEFTCQPSQLLQSQLLALLSKCSQVSHITFACHIILFSINVKKSPIFFFYVFHSIGVSQASKSVVLENNPQYKVYYFLRISLRWNNFWQASSIGDCVFFSVYINQRHIPVCPTIWQH